MSDQKIAFLLTNDYEPSELTEPWKAVEGTGATPVLISPASGSSVEGKEGKHSQKIDLSVADANPEDYAALVLPGGTGNADLLRLSEEAVAFARSMSQAGKTVAAICHGSWILTDAEVVKGKKMTSFASLKTDLKNAGATWVDEELVVDGNLITSRTPDDLPVFTQALAQAITA